MTKPAAYVLGLDEIERTQVAVIDPDQLRARPEFLHMPQQRFAGRRVDDRADVGVGVTGIAGPGGGSDAKPVGTVVIAVSAGDTPAVPGVRRSRRQTSKPSISGIIRSQNTTSIGASGLLKRSIAAAPESDS